jgi:hypothetical protein
VCIVLADQHVADVIVADRADADVVVLDALPSPRSSGGAVEARPSEVRTLKPVERDLFSSRLDASELAQHSLKVLRALRSPCRAHNHVHDLCDGIASGERVERGDGHGEHGPRIEVPLGA